MQKLTPQEYPLFDSFCQTCGAHFMQSPRWGQVKQGWVQDILVLRDADDTLCAGIQLLRRKLPIGCLLYAPRGPVFVRRDPELIRQLLADVRTYARQSRALLCKIDPDFPAEDSFLQDLLLAGGFRLIPPNPRLGNTQPHFVYRLNISGKSCQEVFASFRNKTRYNIRLAERKGVYIQKNRPEDLPRFYTLLQETGKRDGFPIRPLVYYQRLLKEMGPHAQLYLAYFGSEPLAGAISICYGGRTWYLYGASTARHRQAMPNYLMQYSMICDAVESGCSIYDFRGISGQTEDPKHPLYGLYRFKRGFNGYICELTGEYEQVLRPCTYILFRSALAMRNLLKKILFSWFRHKPT